MARSEGPMKGGGQRGGSKRWTSNGPQPARPILWPEIFKHHESVLLGHLKMVEMVRKHTTEGTGDHSIISAVVERTQAMINDFKETERNFVPPKDQIMKVPLGVSSASMYRGYSPVDYTYSEAANEYGRQVAEAKRWGLPTPKDSNGPECVAGQLHSSKKQALQNGGQAKPSSIPPTIETNKSNVTAASSEANANQPLFFIDTNPTPVNFNPVTPGTKKEKRRKSNGEDTEPRNKKTRTTGPAVYTDATERVESAPMVETDDISAEVEERLKAKEEKRKKREKKEEKKRKRQQEDSSLIVDDGAGADARMAIETAKPKKKKPKTGGNNVSGETLEIRPKHEKRGVDDGATSAESGLVVEGEGRKKKKRKKDKDTA